MQALGLDMRDLFPTPIPLKEESSVVQKHGKIIGTYDYNDVDGQLLY